MQLSVLQRIVDVILDMHLLFSAKIQQKESELIAIIKDKPDQAARLLDTYKKLGVTLNAKIYNMLFAGFGISMHHIPLTRLQQKAQVFLLKKIS